MTESSDLPVFWSGRPSTGRVTVPPAVASVAAGRPTVPVWLNEAGGLTFEVTGGAERCFVKWAPAGSDEPGLAAEADRIEWARRFHPVPRPLARGQDAEGSWLVTAPVPGDSAVTARWKAEPAVAVTAIGQGLRAMHDSLPTAGCPFSWSAEERLAAARRKAGIADRWADLAIATWSIGWNYGPGWERQLLDAYGVEPDPERTRYYRLLWDLG